MENIAEYAPEPDLVLVCVLKRKLPSGGAQAKALAELLDRWATENSDPYVGQHLGVVMPTRSAQQASSTRSSTG